MKSGKQTFLTNIKANYSIAYADCFAASLALAKNAIIVTGDPEFKKIEEAVNICMHI